MGPFEKINAMKEILQFSSIFPIIAMPLEVHDKRISGNFTDFHNNTA